MQEARQERVQKKSDLSDTWSLRQYNRSQVVIVTFVLLSPISWEKGGGVYRWGAGIVLVLLYCLLWRIGFVPILLSSQAGIRWDFRGLDVTPTQTVI